MVAVPCTGEMERVMVGAGAPKIHISGVGLMVSVAAPGPTVTRAAAVGVPSSTGPVPVMVTGPPLLTPVTVKVPLDWPAAKVTVSSPVPAVPLMLMKVLPPALMVSGRTKG